MVFPPLQKLSHFDFFLLLLKILIIPCVGDERAGKSTLLHRLQGRKQGGDDGLKGTGIEYTYLDIKEEETEGETLSFKLLQAIIYIYIYLVIYVG